MRQIQTLHPTDQIPAPPDSVFTLLIAGSSGQASDWLSTGSTAMTSASAAKVQIARFSGMSTAGATINFMLSLESTAAAAPSSGYKVGASSGGSTASFPVMGQGTFQIPAASTGWSVAALSSGYIIAEFWKK